MLTGEVKVTVYGDPKPKGSMKCVGQRGKVKHQLVEDNKGSTPWREQLGRWLVKAPEQADKGQPVGVGATFTVRRANWHHVAGDPLRPVKSSAPQWPTSRSTNDEDKLRRLLNDAIQDAGIVPDDAAIVTSQTTKVYPDSGHPDGLKHPGVVVRIWPVR